MMTCMMRSGCDGEYSCFQDDDRSEERVAAFRIVLSTVELQRYQIQRLVVCVCVL